MTRVLVTRSGGFAGITRTSEVTDPDAVGRLLEALRAATVEGAGRPDGFVYDFAVESSAEGVREQYSLPESALPAGIRDLLP